MLQRAHRTFTQAEKQLKFDVLSELRGDAQEIVDALMEGVRAKEPAMIKLAMAYSLGQPTTMRRKLKVPELVNASPLDKPSIIARLVAAGELSLEDAKQLSTLAESELEAGQLRVLQTFVSRISAGEDVGHVASSMLPMIRNLENPNQFAETIRSTDNVEVLHPVKGSHEPLDFLE